MLHSTARSGGNIDQLCHDLKTQLLLYLPITITPWHFNQSDDNLTIFRLSDWSTFLSGCPSDLVYEGFRSYTSYLVVCFSYSKLWRPARSAANHQRSHPTNHQRPGPTTTRGRARQTTRGRARQNARPCQRWCQTPAEHPTDHGYSDNNR